MNPESSIPIQFGRAAGGGDVQAALDAGVALAKPTAVENLYVPHVVTVPADGRVEVFDLEEHAPRPLRPRGRYTTATVDSFMDYVERHQAPDATTIWIHPVDGTIAAVLNDHGDGHDSPEWRDWRAELALRITDEWQHWKARDGVLGDQEAFAEHIEDGLAEIAEPPGADLLEIAQTFHATTSAQFRQATRLQDGRSQFRYDEDIDAKAGLSGELTIPQEITLILAPYVGEVAVPLTARLRYRLTAGHLKIGYKLDRPARVQRETLEQIADRITDRFDGRVYLGSPPE